MLIEPASKVSVPLTVVMRTRSSVPERAELNPPPHSPKVLFISAPEPAFIQVVPLSKDMVAMPEYTFTAPLPMFTIYPAVLLRPYALLVLPAIVEADVYPDEVTEPEPI